MTTRRLLIALFSLIAPAFSQSPGYLINTIAGGGPPITPVPATSVEFTQPGVMLYVAADDGGTVYFTANNCAYKVDKAGVLTRVAGRTTASGYSGDGGLATRAAFNNLLGIAVDAAANLYLADSWNNRIRKISLATGIVTTVAGNGLQGYAGDGGQAAAAQLNGVQGVAVDRAGNLYIADQYNNRIRKVTASTGIITTVAGNGGYGFSGDGGPAINAQFQAASSVAVDSAGNLYIRDSARIRKVAESSGIVTTLAGNATYGYSGDDGLAVNAQLDFSGALAVDASGNVYLADPNNRRVRRIASATGIITTVAGYGIGGFGDDGLALSMPVSVALDSSGNLYIGDMNQVRKLAAATGTLTTVAGNGVARILGDGGPAGSAQVDNPQGLCLDNSGNLYFVEAHSCRVRKLNLATGTITTVAGTGVYGYSEDGGPATSSQLAGPRGVALDASGNLYIAETYDYIAETYDNRIRKVTTATGIITTVAGNTVSGSSPDGIPATGASLNYPNGVLVDGAGNLYIADSDNNRVRKVTASTGIITTFAGNGVTGYSGDGGLAVNAQLSGPYSMALDSAGNLYIADSNNNRIRKVSAATRIITTVAGGSFGSYGDGGPAIGASFENPQGVAVDASGNLYITDLQGDRVRRVDAATGIITSIAGTGYQGYSGDGGTATNALFWYPQGVVVSSSGTVFVADSNNNAVRVLTPVGTSPLLTVDKTHTASFLQGQNNATYSLTVSNTAGAGPTNATATLTEIIPPGLSLQSMSGVGWNCPPFSASCTRSDALAGGASYPPVTVNVSVGSNAPSQVVNQATINSTGAVPAVTNDATTIAGAPTQLRLAAQPSGGVTGAPLSPLIIQILDANGNIAAGTSAAVTLTSNPAGIASSVNAVNGIATFANLTFTVIGTYTLTATSPGLPSVTTNSFSIGSPLPTVVIDTPAPGAILNSASTLSGWAIDNISSPGTAITSVTVWIDGVALAKADYGLNRPDVCAAYPGRPGCPNVGFSATLSLSAGTHTIKVTAVDSDATPNTGEASITVTVRPSLGATKAGVFRNGTSFLEDTNGNGLYEGGVDRFIANFTGPGGFLPGDIPVAGDWTGDGSAKVGIYRGSTGQWFLDANNNGILDAADLTYSFGGLLNDVPFVGDWTGSGKSCIGIYRPGGSVWLLDLNCNGVFDNTPTDAFFPFGGLAGDVPVVGKWTGAGTRVGVVRKYAPNGVPQGNPFFWVLDAGAANAGNLPENHPPSPASFAFGGLPGDVYVTGDWNNLGITAAGVYRSGFWVLDAAPPGFPQSSHVPGLTFGYGGAAGDIPVTGKW